MTITRYCVLAWLSAAATIAYVHRGAIAVAETEIRHDLGLSIDQMGWVLSGFFIGYAALQVPTGWIGNRWGSRGPLALFSAAWTLATGLMAAASGFGTLLSLRVLCGGAQAGLFPCATQSVKRWLPLSRRALACGALGSFMSVGAALATALTGWLLEAGIGWRQVLLIYLLPGLAWSLLFYLWFRDRPEDHPGVSPQELALIRDGEPTIENESAEPPPTPWLAILRSGSMWFICAQQFCRAAGYMFFISWFPTFLREGRGLSTQQAGWMTSLPLLAVVVGSLAAGWFSDWLLVYSRSRRIARQGVAFASMLSCAALVLPAWWVADPLAAVLLISAGSFCSSFAGPVSYAITIDIGGRHVATVFSIMNTSGSIGAAVFPIVAAALREASGGWDLVLLVFAGMYVVAALCWLLVNPNRTIGE